MKDFGVANAHDRWLVRIEVEQPHESDRFRRRRLARRPAPFDFGEVGRDNRDVVRTGEIEERRPG